MFVGHQDYSFYIIKRTVHAYILGNIKLISRVEQDIPLFCFAHKWHIVVNTQNQFHISKHPSILYLYETAYVPRIVWHQNLLAWHDYWVLLLNSNTMLVAMCNLADLPQIFIPLHAPGGKCLNPYPPRIIRFFVIFLLHIIYFFFFIQCLKHEQQYFIAFKIRSDSRVF